MGGKLSIGQVYNLARGVGLSHDKAVTATAIAMAESSLDPTAVGDVSLETATWGPSIGLWQVRSLKAETGTGLTRDASRLKDPHFNARSMHAISDGGRSWSPWSTYTSGAYAGHLAAVRNAVGAGGKDAHGRVPRGGGAHASPAGYMPGDPGLNPINPGKILGDGGKAAGKALGGLLDLSGVQTLVITGAVVAGGVVLLLVGLHSVVSEVAA